jgi:hypothetical protein
VVDFQDRFGETQTVHRTKHGLQIRRKTTTVILALTAVIGKHAGARIKEERVKAGLTMQALADRSGLKGGKMAICHIETAMDTGVRIGTLYAIAAALSVSPFSLLPPVELVMRESGVITAKREELAV